ncbi:MAG: 1-deoxy-D-xylulose-5-phosphate synthase [bacterium]|nr:1-deoxy-D-xylulose-5-phosphate synthase [bacterium]
MSRYLDEIESPEDLKELAVSDLDALAAEIRERLVGVVSSTGGHLASSLGAVELTVALHYVFDSPRDAIVWDVGHQAYAHKVLTGRNGALETMRRLGGISGFPRRAESPHDPFGAGHASTAVSAALGLAAARDARGGAGKVIAVIGDGSLTGGLCYEGINNAGHRARNFIIVLNDNEMSISRNVGAISAYLNKIITSEIYNKVRTDIQVIVRSIPAIGRLVFDAARRLEESLKNLLTPGILFEELGFRYVGPVDGHDVRALVDILRRIQRMEEPVLLHVLTRKGKGYVHAEEHPGYFHGTSPFDVATGRPKKAGAGATYSAVFGEALLSAARADDRVAAVTAAMASGTGLDRFAAEIPERFFDVGIAEGHAVTFAAGLAAGGMKPVVAIYATFLQRAYDGVVHDVCLQNLPVVFAVDRGGIVGEDGATHSGQFAVSYLRHVPNLALMEPADAGELAGMLSCALRCGRPAAIVYPKGGGALPADAAPVEIGRSAVVREGDDLAILALGPMVRTAEAAARLLEAAGMRAAVINARFVKPLDAEAVLRAARATGSLVTLEENALQGGFGSAVLECLAAAGERGVKTLCLGIPDRFAEHGSREQLLAALGLDAEGVARAVLERFRRQAVKSDATAA